MSQLHQCATLCFKNLFCEMYAAIPFQFERLQLLLMENMEHNILKLPNNFHGLKRYGSTNIAHCFLLVFFSLRKVS